MYALRRAIRDEPGHARPLEGKCSMTSISRKIPIYSDGSPRMESGNGEQMERDADFSKLVDGADTGDDTQQPPASDVSEQVGADADVQSSNETQTEDSNVDELRDVRAKYLRALADLENFKKRSMKERSELLKYQGDKVLFDILEVADNLELALAHSEADPAKLREGVDLIHKSLMRILEKWDVRPAPGLGKQFDPNQHAAISRLSSPDSAPGTILNELKKAYFYKDKLLRPGEVVVAGEPEQGEAVSKSENSE